MLMQWNVLTAALEACLPTAPKPLIPMTLRTAPEPSPLPLSPLSDEFLRMAYVRWGLAKLVRNHASRISLERKGETSLPPDELFMRDPSSSYPENFPATAEEQLKIIEALFPYPFIDHIGGVVTLTNNKLHILSVDPDEIAIPFLYGFEKWEIHFRLDPGETIAEILYPAVLDSRIQKMARPDQEKLYIDAIILMAQKKISREDTRKQLVKKFKIPFSEQYYRSLRTAANVDQRGRPKGSRKT